jgi:hypothetical protein
LSPNDVRQDTVDAQEAVIRYLIDRHGIDVPYYCIGLGHGMPTADLPAPLLERFSQNRPRVVPASSCTLARDGDFHAASGQPAQFFLLADDLVSEESERVTLTAGHYVHGLHAAMYRCVVALVDGAWLPSCRVIRMS